MTPAVLGTVVYYALVLVWSEPSGATSAAEHFPDSAFRDGDGDEGC
jgi:hypothetical protein